VGCSPSNMVITFPFPFFRSSTERSSVDLSAPFPRPCRDDFSAQLLPGSPSGGRSPPNAEKAPRRGPPGHRRKHNGISFRPPLNATILCPQFFSLHRAVGPPSALPAEWPAKALTARGRGAFSLGPHSRPGSRCSPLSWSPHSKRHVTWTVTPGPGQCPPPADSHPPHI